MQLETLGIRKKRWKIEPLDTPDTLKGSNIARATQLPRSKKDMALWNNDRYEDQRSEVVV